MALPLGPEEPSFRANREMKFTVDKNWDEKSFLLIYNYQDSCFYIDANNVFSYTSILIHYVNLEIDETGRVDHAWGYCPLAKCAEIGAVPTSYTRRGLVAHLDKTPLPGVSRRLIEPYDWPVFINQKLGWVCIGDPNFKAKLAVEFAPGSVAILDRDELTALWLHPSRWED